MMRIYAAVVQKERELISERTKASLAAARARGDDKGYRPDISPDVGAAALARRGAAEPTAHRLAPEVEAFRAEGLTSHADIARAFPREMPAPRGWRRALT